MRKLFFLILLSIFQLHAQRTITTKEWRSDLKFMQNRIHKDYASLFIKVTKGHFDKEIDRLYHDIPNLESHEIIVRMTEIVALFKYGHTGIFFNHNSIQFHSFPFHLYEFNDGIFIQGVSKTYKKALGAKVLKVNNIAIEKALEMIKPVVNAENAQYFKAYGINAIAISEVLHTKRITNTFQKKIVLTLQKEGKIFTVEFDALAKGKTVPKKYGFVQQDENWLTMREQSKTPLYLSHLDKIYFKKYLPQEKTVYVRHSKIRDDSSENTANFYRKVFNFIANNEVEKLVIDLRLNGGGNNYLNSSIIKEIIKSNKINEIGKLYVIIGRRTFSACQNLVNELDNYTNAIFVGEPTAENINFWGDARPEILPNSKIPVYLSFAWWQDKPAWENAAWLVPQIPVTLSAKEYSTNQDPILQAALHFSAKGFIHKPMQHIRQLYASGNMEKIINDVAEMMRDPKYTFFDFEKELIKSGKQVSNYSPQGAIQIFSLITKFFPNSPNAWKNLAEIHIKIGDNENGKKLLKKVIALDKNGTIGNQAQKLLKNI